jgi:hypothetical protein
LPVLRWTDRSLQPARPVHEPSPHTATSHEDGVWRSYADSSVLGLKTVILRGLSDAMNMAWIAPAISTMFAALNRNASH